MLVYSKSLTVSRIQAESEVSDKAKREELDAVIKQARLLVLKGLTPPLPASTPDSDPALRALNPPFKQQVRAKSKELLIDEEVRRRKAVKMNLANEGLEARKKDEEVATRKRKAEEDKVWEGMPPCDCHTISFADGYLIDGRDHRVGSWRDFTKNKQKKKKPKVAMLG